LNYKRLLTKKLFKRVKYKHEERFHNLSAPTVIVPLLIDLFKPGSVIDIGCGTGTFLKVFKQYGVKNIKGIDGKWVNKQLLHQNIDDVDFLEADLESLEPLGEKFDIALCLEVAEHLSENSAENFIDTLTHFSDVIVFSAAVPDQGGQNHLNEQWPAYWEKFFVSRGFLMYDIIRSKIWEENSVDFWYKQNTFVFINKNVAHDFNRSGYDDDMLLSCWRKLWRVVSLSKDI
jgi:SAM-dependent methyltransferase